MKCILNYFQIRFQEFSCTRELQLDDPGRDELRNAVRGEWRERERTGKKGKNLKIRVNRWVWWSWHKWSDAVFFFAWKLRVGKRERKRIKMEWSFMLWNVGRTNQINFTARIFSFNGEKNCELFAVVTFLFIHSQFQISSTFLQYSFKSVWKLFRFTSCFQIYKVFNKHTHLLNKLTLFFRHNFVSSIVFLPLSLAKTEWKYYNF